MSAAASGRARALRWLGYLGLYLLVGLWNLSVVVAQRLIEGDPVDLAGNAAAEMTTGLVGFALLAPLLAFFHAAPIRRSNARWSIPLHFLVSAAYCAVFVLLLYGLRSALWPLLWGEPYEYGPWHYRFLMEFLKISLLFWGVYGLVWAARVRREGEAVRTRSLRLEESLARARLLALRGRLHPHFLFNTLNAVSAAMYEDIQTADRMIARLATLLRLTLDEPGDEHSLGRELETIGLYLDLMKARFQDRLSVEVDVAPGLLDEQVPSFLLQPLVENAIRHGASSSGRIDIRISALKDRCLVLLVEDRGPGLAPGAAPGGGVGLTDTAARLEALYGPAGRLELAGRAGGGLTARIEVPLEADLD